MTVRKKTVLVGCFHKQNQSATQHMIEAYQRLKWMAIAFEKSKWKKKKKKEYWVV